MFNIVVETTLNFFFAMNKMRRWIPHPCLHTKCDPGCQLAQLSMQTGDSWPGLIQRLEKKVPISTTLICTDYFFEQISCSLVHTHFHKFSILTIQFLLKKNSDQLACPLFQTLLMLSYATQLLALVLYLAERDGSDFNLLI